jgi:hypothetical protein
VTARLTIATVSRVVAQLRRDPRTIGLVLVVPCVPLWLYKEVYHDQPEIPGISARRKAPNAFGPKVDRWFGLCRRCDAREDGSDGRSETGRQRPATKPRRGPQRREPRNDYDDQQLML